VGNPLVKAKHTGLHIAEILKPIGPGKQGGGAEEQEYRRRAVVR
jgi:hypothetical protein